MAKISHQSARITLLRATWNFGVFIAPFLAQDGQLMLFATSVLQMPRMVMAALSILPRIRNLELQWARFCPSSPKLLTYELRLGINCSVCHSGLMDCARTSCPKHIGVSRCDRSLRALLYTEYLAFAFCSMSRYNEHTTMSAEAQLNAIVVT
jgi:hypothetical protein